VAGIANPEWALDKLREFLAATETRAAGGGMHTYLRGCPTQSIALAQVIEQVIVAVIPAWTPTKGGMYSAPWSSHRTACVRAIAQIEAQEELERNLGSPGPKMDAGALHPWVWESAQVAWSAGSFGDAVRAAARAINAKARQKLDRRNASEWKLLQNAFSTKPPAVGEPRLRLMSDETDETFISLHTGAGALAQGLFMAVRNPANHEYADETSEQVALEQLAAFSVLARFVDRAEVVHA
jgi:hypothetical protein